MLSKGELFPCNVGKRKENFTKNRYKTTFPCKSNNYVNLHEKDSYITSNEKDRKYIISVY